MEELRIFDKISFSERHRFCRSLATYLECPTNVPFSTGAAIMELSDDLVYAFSKKYSLTEDEVEDCADVFKLLSQGQIGVPNREVKGALQLLKQNPRDAAVEELLEEIGSSGSIADFESFLYIFRSIKEETSEAELLDSFKIFDRKGDGYIDSEDFLLNLTTLGEPLTERQAQQIVDEVTQADGRIRYADFVKVMQRWH